MQAQGRVLPSSDVHTPNLIVGGVDKQICGTPPFVAVGHAAQVRAPAGLSDAQREVEILHAQRDVYRCEREWMEHGDFDARGALSAARLRLLALESARGQ